jgi:hypothetical protein
VKKFWRSSKHLFLHDWEYYWVWKKNDWAGLRCRFCRKEELNDNSRLPPWHPPPELPQRGLPGEPPLSNPANPI